MKRKQPELLSATVEDSPGPKLNDWNLLRSFVAVYETGTLTEAAKRLGTTQPSVGRHLRELEAEVGETLFVRLPGTLKPTERASALFTAALAMRNSAREAQRIFIEGGDQVVGVVRVAASEAYGYQVLPAMLMPLLNAQPELEIELSVSNLTDNLLRRDADIAVRFFRPEQDDVIALKVGETELGLYAHEDYIDRFGEPVDFALAKASVVAGSDRVPIRLADSVHGETRNVNVRFRFRTDFVLAREAAVHTGFALGMIFVDIAPQFPKLRRVLADRVGLKQEVWLCAHEELNRSARMRFVWDRLAEALKARYKAKL
jgi:DNA-binding transcriptional LysR family regulator